MSKAANALSDEDMILTKVALLRKLSQDASDPIDTYLMLLNPPPSSIHLGLGYDLKTTQNKGQSWY